MGELADYMLNGDDCEGCGMPFDDPGMGFPRRCPSCGGSNESARRPRFSNRTLPKVHACTCGKRFTKPEYMAQHQAATGHKP